MIELAAPYSAPTNISFLPNPQFANSEAVDAQMTYDEAADGTPYTYVSRNGNFKLSFSWTDIHAPKMLEIQEFIHEYTGVRVKLIDHEGVVWRAILVTEQTEFVTDGPVESGRFSLTFLAERMSA